MASLNVFGVLICAALLLSLAVGATTSSAADAVQPAAACARGEQLEKLGRDDEAEAAYLEDLKTDAGTGCAPAKLKSLEEAREKDRPFGLVSWDWLEAAAKHVGLALGVFVLALALILVLGLIALQPITRWRRTKNGRLAHRFVRPSVEVQQPDAGWMEKDLSAQFASVVRENIADQTPGGAHLVTGAAAVDEALKPLGELTEAKVAFSLISFLTAVLPNRNFEVSGALRPGTGTAPGVSLALANSKHSVATTTLWGEDFGLTPKDLDAKAVAVLAVAAAAWVEHMIATTLGVGEALLTDDPVGWTLFKVGSHRLENDELEPAEDLLRAALACDSANSGALANLGVIHLRKGEHQGAMTRLEDALTAMESGRKKSKKRLRRHVIEPKLNPDWHRVKHNLAVTFAQWAATERKKGGLAAEADQHDAKGHEHARELAIVEMRILDRPPRRAPSILIPRLEDPLLPSTLTVYASTTRTIVRQPVEAGGDPDMAQLLAGLERNESRVGEALDYLERLENPAPKLRYNIACAQARHERLAAAARSLERAIEFAPPKLRLSLAKRALTDPTLGPLLKNGESPGLKSKLEDWAGLPSRRCRVAVLLHPVGKKKVETAH